MSALAALAPPKRGWVYKRIHQVQPRLVMYKALHHIMCVYQYRRAKPTTHVPWYHYIIHISPAYVAADDPFQDPSQVTHTRDLLCSAPGYSKDFAENESYYGRWFIFRNFEDLNKTWCVVRDEVMSGRLGAIGASCSTLWYNPQKNGAGPITTGRIGVYTNEHDYIEVGLRLIQLRVIQHDIKYKTLRATHRGEFSLTHENTKRISSKTIFWNKGRPYAAEKMKRGTSPCYPHVRNPHRSDPKSDKWKVNIVDGPSKQRSENAYGKWIIKSSFDYESEVNVTKLWHKLKGEIEGGGLPVIQMECPRGASKDSPPEIHVTTSEANMEAVGRSISNLVKDDIEYTVFGEKKILKWNESFGAEKGKYHCL